MIAEISALDTLFFRDGKPFSRGEETWADGVFPPYPSVIYGALRTYYIAHHESPCSGETIKESENIVIRDIQYLISDENTKNKVDNYLPMPLDMAEPESNTKGREKEYEVIRLSLKKIDDLVSNHPFKLLLLPPEGQIVETVGDGLIQRDDLVVYLGDAKTEFKIKKVSDHVKSEPKTGIGRDDYTHTASDALLYRVGMRRPKNFQILVEFDWPSQRAALETDNFLIKLGAENKVAKVNKRRRSFRIQPEEITLKSNRFKLYLSTPAIFENGWMPDLAKHGINAQLVAAAVGKPLYIGGFDMEKGKPKPMYRAVPAGSVYFYETSDDVDAIKAQLFGKAISDKMPEQGFGIAYLGNWNL